MYVQRARSRSDKTPKPVYTDEMEFLVEPELSNLPGIFLILPNLLLRFLASLGIIGAWNACLEYWWKESSKGSRGAEILLKPEDFD